MARIAIGGFAHETNTFAPVKARYQDFVMAGGWPALCRGAGLFDAVAGINLSIAGFIDGLRAAGHELAPLSWCSAIPSAQVERAAYERIVGDLLRDLKAADQAMFRHLGVEPGEQKILVLKSSVHFRADFEPIAEQILVVAAPGSNPVDHRTLTYRRLRPGVRVMPLSQ
ncbi:MAG: M81 family metallopeptidase [Dongiaceae bacterium]